MTTIAALSSRVANAHARIDGKADKDGGVISAVMRFANGIQLAAMSDPASPPAGNAWLYASTAGTPRWRSDAGQTGNIPLTGGNGQTFSATTTGFSNLTAAWPIAANDPNAGTVYRVRTWGKGTQGSTAQLFATQVAVYGSNAASGWAATKIPANADFYWEAEATLIVITTGSGGTMLVKNGWSVSPTTRAFDGTAPFAPFNFVGISATTQSCDTTASTTLSITGAWGAVTGGPTISGMASSFERLGA